MYKITYEDRCVIEKKEKRAGAIGEQQGSWVSLKQPFFTK